MLAAQQQLRDALQKYSAMVGMWRTCVAQLAAFEFGAAAEMIVSIEAQSSSFYMACVQVGGAGGLGGLEDSRFWGFSRGD